ncbi:MAG: phosphoadenylyl-sulfate reductase [Verrucomicrobia bacterium]|nr:phosphoadenylyl-sulfate reductase [Verrucomicrobiota bacterium]
MKTIMNTSELAQIDAEALREDLNPLSAEERITMLGKKFAGRVAATTSFGLQASVMLRLMRTHAPDVPVVFVDTGYLFPETYRYADALEKQLGMEARVYMPKLTPARQEALHGRFWEQGPAGMEQYARINKIEPMSRALQELGADIWISGLRRSHSKTRASRGVVEQQSKTVKVYPILEWSDADVEEYMKKHGLPPHPLADEGYATMGDWHSTKPLEEGETAEGTRFNGEKYECGLHQDSGVQDFQI